LSLPKLSPRRVASVDDALKARLAANSRPPSYGGGWGGLYLSGRGYGPAWANRDYEAAVGRIEMNPLVRMCLGWYTDAVTQVSFRVGRKIKKGSRKGEYEVNQSHDLNAILDSPCPVFTAEETWAQLIAAFIVDGNAYMAIVRDNGGQPRELWWVPNWQVEIKASGDPRRPIAAYRVCGVAARDDVEYPPEDVVHIRDLPDPRNPLVGMSRLRPFLPHLLAVQSGGEYINEALTKGNTGIVLMPPAGPGGGSYEFTEVEEAQMRAHQRRIQDGLARGGNNPVMFLTANLVHETIGLSPDEMKADTILDRSESYAFAACGLNPVMFGVPSATAGSTFNNVAEATRSAWEDGALPKFGRIAYTLKEQVLYRRDPDTGERVGQFGDPPGMEVWPDTSEVPALREDQAQKSEYLGELFDRGIITREYYASQLDIPEEAIPEEEGFEPGGDGDEDDAFNPGSDDPGAFDFKAELRSFEDAESLLESLGITWDELESMTDDEVAALDLSDADMELLGLQYEDEGEDPGGAPSPSRNGKAVKATIGDCGCGGGCGGDCRDA
jgi:hypothetical protein